MMIPATPFGYNAMNLQLPKWLRLINLHAGRLLVLLGASHSRKRSLSRESPGDSRLKYNPINTRGKLEVADM